MPWKHFLAIRNISLTASSVHGCDIKLAKKLRLGGKGGRNKNFVFGTPKGTSLHETSYDKLVVKIGAVVLAAGRRKYQKNSESMHIFAYLRGDGRNGKSYRDEILHSGRGPRLNHPCKFK